MDATALVSEVPLPTKEPGRFARVLEPEDFEAFQDAMDRAGRLFAGRRFWHVNSTAQGGGVAEMLGYLVPYLRGAGVDCRWAVIRGADDFFLVTKRLHNLLHGLDSVDGGMGDAERRIYESTLAPNARDLASLVAPGDVVVLHDPQTAGLTGALKEAGATVIHRVHVGIDEPDDVARGAWDFLRPYVAGADALVFSRAAFVWDGLDRSKVAIIPPCIDAFSTKNQHLPEERVAAILGAARLLDLEPRGDPAFTRDDGSEGRVRRRGRMAGGGPLPPAGVPLVVQVSRWDRLKDPLGIVEGFARHVRRAHLVVAGPDVEEVADDPEGSQVLAEAKAAWRVLPEKVRSRIHLAVLPMDDAEENAAMVNALQRRADVIVQKSLAEGFGLTVAEAMWKGRPLVASRVGGIQDQIEHGVSGTLVDDPMDLDSFGKAVAGLLEDRERASRMGREAHRRVRREFLGAHHLIRDVELVERITTA